MAVEKPSIATSFWLNQPTGLAFKNTEAAIQKQTEEINTHLGQLVPLGSNLSVMGPTTSAELAGVLTDETGSGVAVFNINPNFSIGIYPITDDGASLGNGSLGWSDLHLAVAATLNVANGNWVMTHTSAVMTVTTGDLRVTTAGTNAASVVTVGGTQTLTNKTWQGFFTFASGTRIGTGAGNPTACVGTSKARSPAHGRHRRVRQGLHQPRRRTQWTAITTVA